MMSAHRTKTPVVLQMEIAECGAAALGIILGFHGRHESLARLREVCGVSRDGSNAMAILAAARSFGLDAHAYRSEIADLRSLRGPFIVFWKFNHFVVVERLSRRTVYVNDPASGRRSVALKDFDKGFTGIVLTFSIGPNFNSGEGTARPWDLLRGRFQGLAPGLTFVALTTLALILPSMVAAALPKVFFDGILIDGSTPWLRPLLLFMTAATVAIVAVHWLQQQALLRVENRLAVSSASRFFSQVLSLPISFFSQRHAGEIADRVGANDRVAGLIAGELSTNVVNALLVGVYIALMLRYDVVLTMVSLSLALMNVVTFQWAARRRSQASRRLSLERGKVAAMAIGGIASIENMKAMGAEDDFFSRWASQHARASAVRQEFQCRTQWLSTMPPFLTSVNTAMILGIGGLRVSDGLLTLGLLVTFQGLTQSFLDPINRLLQMAGRVVEVQGDLIRLNDVLDHTADPELSCNRPFAKEARLSGGVAFANVTFGYSRLVEPMLKDFTLQFPVGSRIALVGASGSGKSTIAKLLCGLYQPWVGDVLLDGLPRSSWSRQTVTNSIAMVDQDITLFSGSIADNIRLLDRTLSDSAVVRAALDAAIHEEILAKPEGYGFQVEEMGRNLSGGQRQRLEIARALATDPRILVLDEATSALDTITEKAVMDNLRRRGCTCIFVAHRLSTIRDCDAIVVIQNGRIVEQGTHEELVAAGGAYYALLT